MATEAHAEEFNRQEWAAIADRRHQKMAATVIPYASLEELPPIVQDQMAHLPRDNRKPKVLALYYGGTLGMHWEDVNGKRVLVPTDDAREVLQPLEKWGVYDRMDVVWFPVLEKAIDSTNGRWPHWVTIGNAIRLLYDYFDGFGIIGGTDTVRFLLASLHFQFPNLGKPAMGIVGQKEASGWGSDAPENMAFGLEAATADISGAHLAAARRLMDGRHVFKVKDREYDAFDCPRRFELGHFEGRVVTYPNCPRRNPLVTAARLEHNPHFRDGIFSTEIQPFGAAESLLHMSKDPFTQTILLITYGAGNVRDEAMFEGEMTHVDVIQELHRKRFPIVLGSPMQDGKVDSHYATGDAPIKVGAISGGDTTGATLYVKMSRALYNSWWTEERKVEVSRNVGNSNMAAYIRDNINARFGLDYGEFRRQMYRSHIGELNMEIEDVKRGESL